MRRRLPAVSRRASAGRHHRFRFFSRRGQHLRQSGQAIAFGGDQGIARADDRVHLLQQLLPRIRFRNQGRKRLHRTLRFELQHEELVPHQRLELGER